MFVARCSATDIFHSTWQNGGPGCSSLIGFFEENGPLQFVKPGENTSFAVPYETVDPATGVKHTAMLQRRDPHWAQAYNVLFIDNPIGTGFSHVAGAGMSNDSRCYSKSMPEVGAVLTEFLLEIYERYPALLKVPLYIAGESYAGKYLPAFALSLANLNRRGRLPATIDDGAMLPSDVSSVKSFWQQSTGLLSPRYSRAPPSIPLRGVLLGDGYTYPVEQIQHHTEQLIALSIIAESNRDEIDGYVKEFVALTSAGQYTAAMQKRLAMFDRISEIAGPRVGKLYFGVPWATDCLPRGTLRTWGSPLLNGPGALRKLMGLPAALPNNHTFVACVYNLAVQLLSEDNPQSIAHAFPYLLTHEKDVRVLFYEGQVDLRDGPYQNYPWIVNMTWPGAAAFRAAKRTLFYTDGERTVLGGYAQQSAPLTYVTVVGAGHMVPLFKPEAAFVMMLRFVSGLGFFSPSSSEQPQEQRHATVIY